MTFADITKTFSSLGAFIDYATPCATAGGLANASRDGEEDQTGTRDFAEALALARGGWLPEKPDFDELISGIQDRVRDIIGFTVIPQHDVVGGAVDMGAYLAGDPECMVNMPLVESANPNRSIVLVVNISTPGVTSTDKMLERGAAICALVQILAELGVNVEIWVGIAQIAHADKAKLQHNILIKPASDPIDISAIAYALAHPSFLRRLVFSAGEQLKVSERRHWGLHNGRGYGAVGTLSLDGLDPTLNIGPLVDRRAEYGATWVVAQLRECGVEVDD